jgi:hypothetical protein
MNFRRWTITVTVALLFFLPTEAQSDETEAIVRHCTEPKPFREVAQDEIKTIAELCAEKVISTQNHRAWSVASTTTTTSTTEPDQRLRSRVRHASRD